MTLIVQKFGGSSLSDAHRIKHVAQRVANAWHLGKQVVVVVSAMGDTTDDLIDLATEVSIEPDPRELDLLLSSGELVSCALLTMAIRSLGLDAVSLTGLQAGIHTDTSYGRARISRVDAGRVASEINENRIAVVAGFQGVTEHFDVTTLGRGGSDTTAVALAVALNAERCEVYTDVEGIYTADPKIVAGARKIDNITFEEMLELAAYGAKMHPRSIELAATNNMPIYVASSFNETSGTLIYGDMTMMEHSVKVTGVAYDRNVAKITLRGVPDRPGIAANLFEPLASLGISVDTIVQNASIDGFTDLSFTVIGSQLDDVVRQMELARNDVRNMKIVADKNLAKVSIVGAGMLDAPGYASRMFRALADASINIEMITTSEIRITCIISEDDVLEAVRVLHQAFGLETP